MKLIKILFIILSITSGVFAKLNVVSSVPDIGILVEEIGKEKVKNITLATGYEDIHAVPLRPSFAVKLRRADILFSFGLGAEHAWLDALAQKSRNRKIMKGNEGWIELNDGLKVLEIPETIDRSEGHQHPDGNPHYNLSPEATKLMIKNIAEVLGDFDPKNSDFYLANSKKMLEEIDKLIVELKEKGKILQGKKIISYHADVVYLCDFYEMQTVGTIEPKPGIPPTMSNMSKVVEDAKKQSASIVLYSLAQDPKLSASVASKIGVKSVMFYNMLNPEFKSVLDFHRRNLDNLLEGLK